MKNSEIQENFQEKKSENIQLSENSNQKFAFDFSDKLIVKKRQTKMDIINNQLAMTLISTIGICKHVKYK